MKARNFKDPDNTMEVHNGVFINSIAVVNRRYEKHWSRAELQRRSGLAYSTIYKAEHDGADLRSGRRSVETLLKLAAAFRCNPVELLSDVQNHCEDGWLVSMTDMFGNTQFVERIGVGSD